MVHFILYSRSYCHLCDDMLAALENLRAEFDFSVEVIDVDADAALVERYDELVPVLVGQRAGQQDGQQGGHQEQQLCHYFLDLPVVRDFLTRIEK